jgi:molybdate transport system permease protein
VSAESQIILLSVKIALISTILILPIGVCLGWLLARKNFVGKSFVDAFINIPLVLPPVVTGYFLLISLGPSGFLGKHLKELGIIIAFDWPAAVIAAAVVSLPLLVRTVRVAIENVDRKLEDAARMLRAKEPKIFFGITLPLAANGIIAGTVLAFARAIGEFGATIIFATNIPDKTQTIPLAIFTFLNQPDGEEKVNFLVIVSIIFAYLSMLLNEYLVRRIPDARS